MSLTKPVDFKSAGTTLQGAARWGDHIDITVEGGTGICLPSTRVQYKGRNSGDVDRLARHCALAPSASLNWNLGGLEMDLSRQDCGQGDTLGVTSRIFLLSVNNVVGPRSSRGRGAAAESASAKEEDDVCDK